ncbi:heme-degrading domain-containing protein [Pleomorphochaeta sp. DL1XJH-081]|uniref:heme-degrading domain-containing protein n=1 Tax=Pleomorphochaeta sp. DL1XJH-081 TaxID=3409690 RepID=UPI003BB74297
MEEMLGILLQQEKELHFNRFDSEVAWKIGSWVVQKARKEGLPIAVDISVGARCLFHWSSNGAEVDNEKWIERKSRSVMRFGHSSYYLGRRLVHENVSAAEKHYVDEADYAFHGGSFPIFLRGTGLIGTMAVSGLKQEDDHDLVVQALSRALRKQDSVPSLKNN